jgi:MFS family permease
MTSYEPKPAASHARRASDSEAQGGSTVAGRLILALVCVAQLMVVLDVSIVNVALPSIGAGLGFSPTALQWMINTYNIAFGGFLLSAGRAADLYGPERTFLAGVGVFSTASMAGGLAPSSEVLVVARFLVLFSATRPPHSRRVAQPACWGR